MYRDDVFNDPTEKENFLKKYGYELAPATAWNQMRDLAEFFTRKKGEMLKGAPLKNDLYGVGLMGGKFPHVQDEISSILWGMGGNWAKIVRDETGKPLGFRVSERDKAMLKAAFATYVELMQFAPPGSLNAFWDFVMAQFAAGNIIIALPVTTVCIPG